MDAKITKFIKANENAWRCEIKGSGLDFTVSALITLDQAYPEIPPIFALDKAQVRNANADEELKEGSDNIESLLRQIEDELNIHHGDFCDHATQGDLLLSFQLRKLLACVELLKTPMARALDPESLERLFAFDTKSDEYAMTRSKQQH